MQSHTYEENISHKRRLEIHNLIQEYKAGKIWSIKGKLCNPK